MTIDDKWLTVILENQCAIMLSLARLLAHANDKDGAHSILQSSETTIALMKRDLGYDLP